MKKKINNNCDRTILLIDNGSLSYYTSYLAFGLSKYRKIILYGSSIEDYTVTGAATRKDQIEFHQMEHRIPGRSFVNLFLRPALIFSRLFSAILFHKYDLIHIQGHLPTFFLFIPYLKLKKKRIFWTLHDVNLRPSTEGFRGKIELIYASLISQPGILYRHTDGIVVHGSVLRDQLISKGVKINKIQVMPHFDYCYLLQYSESFNGKRGRFKSSNSPALSYNNYVLLFGRIKPYKGIDIMIKAARMARQRLGNEFKVLIAGLGDISYFSNLLITSDHEYIHIRNELIPILEIPNIFEGSRFIVLPYRDASQSGVIPLAYTFSKAVVASNVGSITEAVDHGKTGFVFNSGNAEELAEYIVQLYTDIDLCRTMGMMGFQKLNEEMSLDGCCKVLLKLYEKNE